MSQTNYHIGKGPVLLADRDPSGNPGAYEDVGEVMYSLEITKEYKSNFSSRNAVNEKDAHVPVSQEVKGTLSMKEPMAKNLQLILHGATTENEAADIEEAAFPPGIVAGETYAIPGATGIVGEDVEIVDSGVAPNTLVEGTHYTADRDYGTVKFISVVGKTQPFKITCSTAASTDNSILTRRVVNKALRFHGLNVGNNDGPRKFLDVLHNITLLPAQKIEGKGEDFATYEVPFECLADPMRAEDPAGELSRYGFHRKLE